MMYLFKQSVYIPENIKLYKKDNFLIIKNSTNYILLELPLHKKDNVILNGFFKVFQKSLFAIFFDFTIRLAFIGIGFRVDGIENDFLKLKLGFSHFIFIKIPKTIKLFLPKKTLIVLQSKNEQFLKEFSWKICSTRFPDTYKGKGIKFKNQILILKPIKKK